MALKHDKMLYISHTKRNANENPKTPFNYQVIR